MALRYHSHFTHSSWPNCR